jgi:2-polyprenyl-3-methyl-5-hydroxy-6-metoxy-1,4-benzoquinol methylase
MAEDWRALNRAWWDERVPLHVASELYGVDDFRAGADRLREFEVRLAGDVAGLRLLHLQCHFGQDTMGWARRGASVVGLDFSQPAVDAANGLATELGLDARFVCSDVYDAVAALGGERFDLVCTGLGALNWLPDLARWADVVAALIAPGGRLLLAEFHPVMWMFEGDLTVVADYFGAEPYRSDVPGSYADADAVTEHNRTIEFQHPLGEVLGELLRVGLRIVAFEELDHTLFPALSCLEQRDGAFRWPAGAPRVPAMYAVVAQADG